jgi:hypothetical protein
MTKDKMTRNVGHAPATPSSKWRRYAGWIVGLLATFGIFGAVGSNVVDEIFPAAKEKISGATPLHVTVREDPQGGSDGFTVAARSPAGLESKLRNATGCDALFVAAKRAGAVDVYQSIHDVLLEGRTFRDVTIVDMRAKVLTRKPALRGAAITCASAGALDSIGVMFKLDEANPLARKIRPGLQPGEPYFRRGNAISLKSEEVQPLQVVAQISSGYVEWEVEADAIIDGERRTITINNSGKPFRLTGARPAGGYARYFEWVWYEQPPYLYAGDQAMEAAAAEPTPLKPPGTTSCGERLAVGPHTSCAFAANVRSAYQRGDGGARTVTALSPVTGQRYEMSCTGERPHKCTGGNDASVYFW